jgi:hydrogenase nickel incorporation protein HypB
MCVTCGCGNAANVRIDGKPHGDHEHILPDGTRVVHRHEHDHAHNDVAPDLAGMSFNYVAAHAHPTDGNEHAHGPEHAHTHEPPSPAQRREPPLEIVKLETALLDKNQRIAERNRGWLAGRDVLALNLMSSPGAGKTTLLVRTLTDLAAELPMAVIEGDQETDADAERIRASGARAVQINTGAGCHLEADMLERALQTLSPARGSIVFIENVGNLVCPALFDLGERARVVVLSVTEGDDKPLKYPHMFRSAQMMVLTKIDLLPHVRFDAERAEANARSVNPAIQCLRLSAESGAGLAAWFDWLRMMRADVAMQAVL